jgi:hypothetical protein
MPTTLLAGALALLVAHAPDPAARAVLDTAAARMGGIASLRAVERVRRDVITEWQQTTFDARPNTPVAGYEWDTELRDYTTPAWRYTRRSFTPTGLLEIVDLVTDSVAAIKRNGQWAPQNVAYLDERDQVFTFAPERIMVLAYDAADAHALPDTTMAGVRYARVSVTAGRFHPTLFFRRGDGLLALARFRAAEPNDFGLAPWGEMDVDIWYSRWSKSPDPAITIPTQLDIYRVGRPYKRMTTIGMKLNPVIPADSFAISDSLRAAYLATARRPMFDLPVDTAKIVDGAFAVFGTGGTPAGAVKVGGRWLFIEAGTAPLSIERSAAFLRRAEPSAEVAGALVTAPVGAGGLAWLAERATPTWVAASARPQADAALRGWKRSNVRLQTINADRWIRVGSDSLRVESIDAPDYPGMLVVYVPSLRWAYAWHPGAAQMDYVLAHVRRRGWAVDRVGSTRAFVGAPLPPAPPSAAR